MGGMIRLWNQETRGTIPVMSRDEVRALDAWAIETMGIPGVVLMENAGRSAAEVLWRQLEASVSSAAVIFCGAGNNGGDGFVIARHLANRGVCVHIVLCTPPEKVRGEAQVHFDIARAMGLAIDVLDPASDDLLSRVRSWTDGADWIVDAYLGTGLRGEVSDPAARLIAAMNAAGKPILAVDIPSGLDCDRGIPLPVCVEAKITVTFAAMKQGLASNPDARRAAGEIYVASIGIDPAFRRA
jgi:hydroxyethylthiazole kinase-like uncharacterized protein yjeF